MEEQKNVTMLRNIQSPQTQRITGSSRQRAMAVVKDPVGDQTDEEKRRWVRLSETPFLILYVEATRKRSGSDGWAGSRWDAGLWARVG